MATIVSILNEATWSDDFLREFESCLNDRIAALGMEEGAVLTRVLAEALRIEYPTKGGRTKRVFVTGLVLWDPEHPEGVPGLFCCNGRLANRIRTLNHHGNVPTFKLYYDHDSRKWDICGTDDMQDRLSKFRHLERHLKAEMFGLHRRAKNLCEEATQYRSGA